MRSGNLPEMTNEQLKDRLEQLYDADPDDVDSVQDFADIQAKICAIEDELDFRQRAGILK